MIRLLQTFMKEVELKRILQTNNPTFIHHNGKSKSQIDYILPSEADIISKCSIADQEHINLSAHLPVTAELSVKTPTVQSRAKKKELSSHKRILMWDKVDSERFCQSVQENLRTRFTENNENGSQKTMVIVDCLIKAANCSVPTKTTCLKGPTWKASPIVRELQNKCKINFNSWKVEGRHHDGMAYEQMRQSKKDLRSRIRQERCMAKKDLYQELMRNPNSKLFYRLIHRNRNGCKTNAACISYNGSDIFSPEEQRLCFARFYEDLAVPKDSGFDSEYMNFDVLRHNIINELF